MLIKTFSFDAFMDTNSSDPLAFNSAGLSLTLLMARISADHQDDSLTPDNLAMFT